MTIPSSPNITFMLQYTEANSQYVDYTNRKEAVQLEEELLLETHRQSVEGLTDDQLQALEEAVPETKLNFREYIDYMNRSYATENQSEEVTAVFNQDVDYLPKPQLTDLKNKLETAYQNGSLLWQGVISFDNSFLAEQGLYDVATGQVDQKAIKAVIRDAMPRLMQREGMSETAFWWGNIHLNTDNIHIHFGLSEIESNREKIFYQPRGRMEIKGNFSQKSIQGFKSQVWHGLLKEETRSKLIRKEQILANLKTNLLDSVYQEDRVVSSAEKNLLEQAYNHLPAGKNWRYGSNARDFAVSKFFLDKYLDSYLEHDGKELYQEFLSETRDFLSTYEGVYSAEKNRVYEKMRKVDGKIIRKLAKSKGYDLESVLARRELELRERLANRLLRTFKEAAPQVRDGQLEKNLDHFSRLNQKRILEQMPEASVLHSAKDWQKFGYDVKEDAQGIEIVRPEYEARDKYGNGIGEISYVSDTIYDISQMTENISMKTLTLKDLSFFSSAEIKELVDAAKLKENPTNKEKRELGTYRYALKLSLLEEHQKTLQVRQKLLEQVQPLASDQPFVDFKRQMLVQELKWVELQLQPNYQLSEADRSLKEALGKQFADSVAFPIQKATQEAIEPSIRRLQAEMTLVNQVQDRELLTLLKGYPVSKKAYLDELQAHLSIFQLKSEIHSTNEKMATTTDEQTVSEYRRLNGQRFSELKELYKRVQPTEEQEANQLSQAVLKQLAQQKRFRQTTIQQTRAPLKINTDFMRGLTASLQSAERSRQKALKARIRSDEREEEEEKAQNIR